MFTKNTNYYEKVKVEVNFMFMNSISTNRYTNI